MAVNLKCEKVNHVGYMIKKPGPDGSCIVLSRNKVRPINFCEFLKVRRTVILELFGSQGGVLRF